MKFSNAFGLAALGVSMLFSGAFAEEVYEEVSITTYGVAPPVVAAAGEAVEETVPTLAETFGTRRRDLLSEAQRKLNHLIDVTIIPSTVKYWQGTVRCEDHYLPPGDCFQTQLNFTAVLKRSHTYDNGISDLDGVDLEHIADDWEGFVKEKLEDLIDSQYAGVKLDVRMKSVDWVKIETYGDPHFKTFSGKYFDYMGACDLKMIHAPVFDGVGKPLDVNVRTKIRRDYSYVESAAIKLGDDVLEVGSFGNYWLNGVENAKMPASVGGYPVTKEVVSDKVTKFTVTLSATDSLVMKNFKDMVAVILSEASPERFVGALGMSGSFDKEGKLLGRDGETEFENPEEFASEWQIRSDEEMLFNVASGPQHPEKCQLPTPVEAKGRRLGETFALEAAEKACAKYALAENMDACVHDVMAIGDIDLAAAGAY